MPSTGDKWAAAGARLHCVARRGEFVQKRPGTCNFRAQCVHPGTKPRIGGVDQNRFAVRKCIDQLHDAVVRAIAPSMPGMNHGKALARRRHAGRPGSIEHDCPCGFAVARQWSDLGDKPLRGLGTVAPPAIRTRPHHVVAVHEHRGLLGLGQPKDREIIMNIIEQIETNEHSATAAACEHAALYGATPERDEFDTRDVWDRDDAIDAVLESFRILAQGVGPDGTQLSDERESLLWGFVNMLDAQTQRLDRAADKLLPGLRDLQREQDGTEIKSRELELVTDRSQNLTARRDAFETMRDAAADAYRVETGSMWRPRRGSHTSQTGKLTSAAIDARDYQRARKDRKTMVHLPQGTLVAITGGKDIADPAAIIARLEMARAKYSDLILVHGGGPGVERIAAQWADRNGVHQIVCKPDWDRHGRAAPFRRNEELLNLLPKGVIAFPGSGITENLVDKARQLGIPVMRAA